MPAPEQCLHKSLLRYRRQEATETKPGKGRRILEISRLTSQRIFKATFSQTDEIRADSAAAVES